MIFNGANDASDILARVILKLAKLTGGLMEFT